MLQPRRPPPVLGSLALIIVVIGIGAAASAHAFAEPADQATHPAQEHHACAIVLGLDPSRLGLVRASWAACPAAEGHGGGAERSRLGNREVDLVLGWNPCFEGHAIGFYDGLAKPVLCEIQPLLFGKGFLKCSRATD